MALMSATLPPTATACKEWAVVVEALRTGAQHVLFRKGGIREVAGRFELEAQQFWLYPTYEHQQPSHVKPAWQSRLAATQHTIDPRHVVIDLYATVEAAIPATTLADALALDAHHLWTPAFVTQRFQWKPEEPCWVLLLRTFRRATPARIAVTPAYGGCRSWVQLAQPMTTDQLQPVIEDAAFQRVVRDVQAALRVDSGCRR